MLVFFLVLLITAVIFWITRPITPDGFFKGEVVGVYQKPSQVPRPALLVVELESGVRVTLRGSGHVKAMMGSPVLVLRSGRGLNPFRFVRYLEEGEEPPELEYDHHQEN